jgi:hypothetical protein
MLNNFEDYINEASLRGNIGIPGEGESKDPSWLEKVKAEKDPKMARFAMENREDLNNFMGLIDKSKALQSGHEDALSDLTVSSFRFIFKGLLDDVEFDFKIGDEARSMGSMTPEEPEQQNVEEIVNRKIINEIHKRKILKTLQQGMGLNSKAILNLPMFKSGIKTILGKTDGEEYLKLLNKISAVAQFNDWRLPDNQIKTYLKMSGAGVNMIDFGDKKPDEDSAKKVLDDLEKGKDFTESDSAEDLMADLEMKIFARGVDLSVLIHEAIKAVYVLPVQLSTEHLSEDEAEQVIMNTDTLLDEAEEFKYGTDMQDDFRKAINSHPEVEERFSSYRREMDRETGEAVDSIWNDLAAEEQRLYWMIFGMLATTGKDDPKEMLKIVYAILMNDKSGIERLFYPIIEEALANLEAQSKYGDQSKKEEPRYEMPTQEVEPEVEPGVESEMSQDEIQDAIIDAYLKGDIDKADRLRKKYLGEGLNVSFSAWLRINS